MMKGTSFKLPAASKLDQPESLMLIIMLGTFTIQEARSVNNPGARQSH